MSTFDEHAKQHTREYLNVFQFGNCSLETTGIANPEAFPSLTQKAYVINVIVENVSDPSLPRFLGYSVVLGGGSKEFDIYVFPISNRDLPVLLLLDKDKEAVKFSALKTSIQRLLWTAQIAPGWDNQFQELGKINELLDQA